MHYNNSSQDNIIKKKMISQIFLFLHRKKEKRSGIFETKKNRR